MSTDGTASKVTSGKVYGPKLPVKRRPKGQQSPTARNKALALSRQKQALEMRLAGNTLTAIAQHLGYADHTGAQTAVLAAMRNHIPKELVDEVRELECARLDRLWGPQYDKALQGDRLAVDRCLNIMDRRARYMGLDAPLRIQQTVISDTDFDDAIQRLNREAEAIEARAWTTPSPDDELTA